MDQDRGFSLIELLIVVAIIAIITGMAIPNLVKARIATNEVGAIAGCRLIGAAEISYSIANSSKFTSISGLVAANILDQKFIDGFNGYKYDTDPAVSAFAPAFGNAGTFMAQPQEPDSTGRYSYGIGADLVVRYMGPAGAAPPQRCQSGPCNPGEPIFSN